MSYLSRKWPLLSRLNTKTLQWKIKELYGKISYTLKLYSRKTTKHLFTGQYSILELSFLASNYLFSSDI